MAEENSKVKEEREGAEEIVYENGDEEISADIEKLRKKLKECREEKEKYLAGWQRSQADFINYRRRQEEQLSEWLKMFGGGLIKDILPVLDSMDAAQKSQPDNEGLTTLIKQLKDILKKHGLEQIKAMGEKFNPEIHEVVEYEEKSSEHGGEVVSDEIQKGYMLNGKIIRVSKVKVIRK